MEKKQLRLVAKSKIKGTLLRMAFSRTGIILFLFLLAVGVVLLVMNAFTEYISQVWEFAFLFNIIVVVRILNTEMDYSAKLTWILVIAFTSVFGGLFYIYTKLDIGNRAVKHGYMEIIEEHRHELSQNEDILEEAKGQNIEVARLAQYLYANDAFPITSKNDITFYPLGENKWEDMLEELQKAEKFIFFEYFILEEGMMWGSILNILKEKASQGVDVRVMYDGTCAIGKVPYNYPKLVQSLGIKCKMHSPLRPFASTYYNYRDHRKILVIDGKVGFTGGVNLADEYINQKEVFGHWKDTAIRIKGEAVKTLTHMFLNMWYFGQPGVDYSPYLNVEIETFPEAKGYAIPYGFNPFDTERVGQRVYEDILYNAKNYVHIITPYLILDDSLLQAIKYAAKRGIDVRIILPGIPDKKAVYDLAKTYIPFLLESGVRVYFYTPGFVHAKEFISDDCKAVVGTINLDYRSLYHHFECGCFLYDVDCIVDIEKDFQDTLSKCSEVTKELLEQEKLSSKILGRSIRFVAPLL